MDEEYLEGSHNSKLKDSIKIIGSFISYLVFLLAAVVLLVLIIKGTPWIAENLYPLVIKVASIVVFFVLPVSLILAIFKKTRLIASIGIFCSSYIIGLSLWIWSLVVAYLLAGGFWMFIGIVFGGVGVVPIALIAAIFKGEWTIVIQITIIAIIVYGLRAFSLYLSEKSE